MANWKSWAVCVNPGRDGCVRGILEYVGHRVMLGPREQTSFRSYFLSVFYWGTVFSSFRLAL